MPLINSFHKQGPRYFSRHEGAGRKDYLAFKVSATFTGDDEGINCGTFFDVMWATAKVAVYDSLGVRLDSAMVADCHHFDDCLF